VEIAEHIDALEAEIEPFAAAIESAGPDAPVPPCPDWSVRDLARHMGVVHRWAATHVRDARTELYAVEDEEIAGGWPADDDLVAWLREGHRQLVHDLRSAPPDLECFTFLRASSPLAMWARRQAHETTVHRIDAQAAAGRLGAVTAPRPALSSDGIDELLTCFITRRWSKFRLDPARTMEVATTDTGAVWSVEVGPDAVITTRAPSAAPDVAIQGRAADLYLFLWNRAGLDGLTARGDETLLAAWTDSVKVRWS